MEKLQRQRALLHEHLRWLDSEIASEASAITTSPLAEAKPGTSSPASPGVPSPPAPLETTPVDLALPETHEPNIQGLHNEVRSGCLLYFGLAFLAFGLVVAFIYWRY